MNGNQLCGQERMRDEKRSLTGSLLTFDAKKLIEQPSGSQVATVLEQHYIFCITYNLTKFQR